ncbi:hypothetical protein [Pseudomonas sp. GD03944]|nr:hypothetical protein [Pseudomonas sp. GD03944]MDH1265164.1 hypothetical protein [Pseudomonas sp. GD03944]
MFDPILIHALCQLTLMTGWFWGWIRHPWLMFAGFVTYLALVA